MCEKNKKKNIFFLFNTGMMKFINSFLLVSTPKRFRVQRNDSGKFRSNISNSFVLFVLCRPG